jgi:hypothetical protein
MCDFPDRPHFEQLRRELWRGRRFGHATVMIGSGFSRNAERLPSAQREFPLWRTLAEELFNRLYPTALSMTPAQEQQRRETLLSASSTRLAQEFATEFGRQALDDLLLTMIPDMAYRPGRLHALLLELPWADVFTTNYDTLLERTRLTDIYYEVVHTAADLPCKRAPRIFKLHGSFPSQRPFIITEDDFRTYPRIFAPLVNSVQQAMLEQCVLLLGFSGDDPNFLYWSGWVRDQLAEHTPKIYLAGVLNFTESQKRLLRDRHIIPIDLTRVVPRSPGESSDSHHARATEWFLLSLKNGQPPDPLVWPDSSIRVIEAPSYLPPLLASPYGSPAESEPLHPSIAPA